MIHSTSTRERRDWTLLVFIIPIGILLMLIAGQVAIYLVPEWSVNAGMQSNLDPNNLPKQQNMPVQPILPAILTPLGWLDTFLTPGADAGDHVVFPPFVVIEPTATPEVPLTPPTIVTTPPTPPATDTPSPTSSPPPSSTSTTKPPNPTSTHPTKTPTNTPTPIVSTPTGTQIVPAPTDVVGTPDDSIYVLDDGEYVVIDLGANAIEVNGITDTNYDLVYYEMANAVCGGICIDQVVIGISNDPDGNTYYVVFNWGDGVPDTNTNIGDVVGTEDDNQPIPSSELYGTPPYQTGILIDVDSAPSHPPLGLYQYLVFLELEPSNPAEDTDDDDGLDIDAIQIVEVPNPTATPVPVSPNNAPPPPAIDAPADTPPESPPADTPPESPANEPSAPPANNVPAPPSNDAPAPPANDAPPADAPPASP